MLIGYGNVQEFVLYFNWFCKYYILQKSTHFCKTAPVTAAWHFRKLPPGSGKWRAPSRTPLPRLYR